MKKLTLICASVLLLGACNQTTKTDTATDSNTSNPEQAATFKAANLNEQMIYQRGVEAVIWSMPVVELRIDARKPGSGKRKLQPSRVLVRSCE